MTGIVMHIMNNAIAARLNIILPPYLSILLDRDVESITTFILKDNLTHSTLSTIQPPLTTRDTETWRLLLQKQGRCKVEKLSNGDPEILK